MPTNNSKIFPIFKTVKKQNLHSRSEKTGDEKGVSALVSVFKLEKTGSLSGGVVFLLLPVIRVNYKHHTDLPWRACKH